MPLRIKIPVANRNGVVEAKVCHGGIITGPGSKCLILLLVMQLNSTEWMIEINKITNKI